MFLFFKNNFLKIFLGITFIFIGKLFFEESCEFAFGHKYSLSNFYNLSSNVFKNLINSALAQEEYTTQNNKINYENNYSDNRNHENNYSDNRNHENKSYPINKKTDTVLIDTFNGEVDLNTISQLRQGITNNNLTQILKKLDNEDEFIKDEDNDSNKDNANKGKITSSQNTNYHIGKISSQTNNYQQNSSYSTEITDILKNSNIANIVTSENLTQNQDDNLPRCEELSAKDTKIINCTTQKKLLSCPIYHKILGSIITPLNAYNPNLISLVSSSKDTNFFRNISYFDSFTLPVISNPLRFKVGDASNNFNGNCTSKTQIKTFIIDNPDAIKKLKIVNAKYKDYMRLNVKVQNVPISYYEGFLGDLSNSKLSSENLHQKHFDKSFTVFTIPNGYLPPIVPLPKNGRHNVCYGTKAHSDNLNLDLWQDIKSRVPTKMRSLPFMVTFEIIVSANGKGYGELTMELDYADKNLVYEAYDTTECDFSISNNFEKDNSLIALNCNSYYPILKLHNSNNTIFSNIKAYGFFEKEEPGYLINLNLLQDLTSLNFFKSASIGSEFEQNSRLSKACKVWQYELSTDVSEKLSLEENILNENQYQNQSSSSLVSSDFSSDKLEVPSCVDINKDGLNCSAISKVDNIVTYACTPKCLNQQVNVIENPYIEQTECIVKNEVLTKDLSITTKENFSCELFFSEALGYSGTCITLLNDNSKRNCILVNSTCLDDENNLNFKNNFGNNASKECSYMTKQYSCEVTKTIASGSIIPKSHCQNKLSQEANISKQLCLGDSCNLLVANNSNSLNEAFSSLGLLQYMQDDITCGKVNEGYSCNIFKGQNHTCRVGAKGSFNCCKTKNDISPYDYIKLTSYILTLEGALKAAKLEGAKFGSWAGSQVGSGLISSELDSLLATTSKQASYTSRTSFINNITKKIASLIEDNFGKELKEKLFLEAGAESASDNVTLNPEVMNYAEGLMQAYVAYKMAVKAYEIATACHTSEQETALRISLDSCIHIGTQCDHKVLGKCVVSKRNYCCYNSQLAKIFMQEIAKQGWGGNSCTGISTSDLANIDFSKIDLSAWENLMLQSKVVNVTPSLESLTGSGSLLNDANRTNAKERTNNRLQDNRN